MAASAPTAAPCHTNCSSAQAVACAAGWLSTFSIAFSVITPDLPVDASAVNGLPNVAQFFRRGALGGERLHDELARRSSERPIEQVAHELTLRGLFAQPGAIDVGAIALVAIDEPLLDHDLKQLERGGVDRRGALARQLVMD